ncbi:MAG: methyltransferase domain-containing protein [Bacteroidales bacterium]|nr:methyltransferase domain-containing protein [Bacteroidales bacterium]
MKNTITQINRNKKNHKTQSPSLGPVNNLEEYLKPDWWRRIFNSMYLKTDADVVEDKSITAYELDMFTGILNLTEDQFILDLACGQGRHSLELARRGFRHVYGLDRSHYLINKARQTKLTENLPVAFREGDARKLPYSTDTFDIVMILGNSFGYFESMEDDIKILKEVLRILKPRGKFLLDVADGNYLRDNFSPRSWEWLDKNHFVCRERSLAGDKQRLISREVISNINKGVIVDQFYAERLYTRENLKEILHKSGFRNINIHDEYKTGSERNQDLGMMERRIIMSAEAIKTWSPVKSNLSGSKNVVVILGDPSKRDIIKPDTVFDEDDYNTLDQLKIALSSLKDYKFTYLDNHDTLISNLIKLRPQVDFALNLCDEGFYNDPRSELHVPALLEMMKIPYSGSNPQCLAYCYDKSLIRGIAKEMDIPVADAFYIKPEDNIFEMNIGFPVIAKPNFGDSSFGITQNSVAYNIEQLNNAIVLTREKLGYDKPILVEELLTGKDLTLGIIGNPPESYNVLPIIEEDYSLLPEGLPKICGYEAKWMQDSPYFTLLRSIEARLDTRTTKQIIEWCLRLSERLECRDYVRFDWRLDADGLPRLLEINPNPGWCWDGHLAKMAAIKGISYADMLLTILEATEQRANFLFLNYRLSHNFHVFSKV